MWNVGFQVPGFGTVSYTVYRHDHNVKVGKDREIGRSTSLVCITLCMDQEGPEAAALNLCNGNPQLPGQLPGKRLGSLGI